MSRAASSRAAFTLAEMMLVMVLVGILLGIGVGGVDRVDPGARGLQTSVEAFVQSSRDRARSSGHPVELQLEAATEQSPARLVRFVFRRSLEANFEPDFAEREGVEVAAPAELGKAGRVGAGLDLSLGGGATIVNRGGGAFASPDGIQIECDFRCAELSGAKLFEWKDLGELTIRADGSLQWSAIYGDGTTWADQDLDTPPGVVRKGRWHHLRAVATSSQMLVFVDGELVAEREAVGQLPRTEKPPFLGDPDGRFVGKIDEFVVWSRALEAGPSLNAEQDMFLGALAVIFDRFGRLDPRVHSEPVEVRISALGTETGAFRIGVFTEEVAP